MNLTGNTILITGGSAGIGLALAEEFVRLGNKVIITGRDAAKLGVAKKKLGALDAIQCDAGDAASVSAMAAKIRSDHPSVNVLINNAGIFKYKNLKSPSKNIEQLTHEIEVNLSGPIRTTSALVDLIVKNKGTIINVSSGLAFVPLMCAPIYSATKAGLHSYTVSLRQQLQSSGVEVIELAPPAVKTELTADMPQDGDIKIISTDLLVKETFAALRAGKLEICPGDAVKLRFMSRLAPGFINAQLAKGSAKLLPSPE